MTNKMGSKIIKFLKYGLFTFLSIILVGFLILWIKSPGTIQPITNAKGEIIASSIYEHKVLQTGRVEQHLTLRGIDSTKQVLLILHGGPGNSINAGLRNPDLILEEEFVVVQWDQYGSGRSYNNQIRAEDMKIDSLVAYAKEVSQYLCKRFNQEKIHIIGHSWGSQLGMILINENPHLFHSYIGMAQTVDLYEAEGIAFQWVKSKAESLNDKKGMKELSQIQYPDAILPYSEWNDQFGWVHRSYVNKYGGIKFGEELNIVSSLLKPLLQTPEYTIKQKVNYIQGLLFSLESTWVERMERPLKNEIDSIQIPVIIVQGLHDYNIPHSQVKRYFDELKAPYKKFYSFEKSAHSPYFEEVDKFNKVIRDEILSKY